VTFPRGKKKEKEEQLVSKESWNYFHNVIIKTMTMIKDEFDHCVCICILTYSDSKENIFEIPNYLLLADWQNQC